MKRALVTGITGQDGSFLTELLLKKGYYVIGVARRTSTDNTERIKHLFPDLNFELIEGDIADSHNVQDWFTQYEIDECYNLAAQSHVQTSFQQPLLTWKVNAEGVLNILEAIRKHSKNTRFYQASTSEMFGSNVSWLYDIEGQTTRYDGQFIKNSCYENRHGFDSYDPKDTFDGIFQDEQTAFSPQSPYAVAKVAAHQTVQLYRQAYNVHGSCGILFNHESERRGEKFVTRKITKWIGEFAKFLKASPVHELGQLRMLSEFDKIYYGPTDNNGFPKLRLGNLDAKRDFGYARDYVEAMWLMLQQERPDDYVIATGVTKSVREFLTEAFNVLNRRLNININYEDCIIQDPKFMRAAEVNYLCGCADYATAVLEWTPKICFEALVDIMVGYDIETAKNKTY